ncbi:MAG: DnaJ domain-containing protein [Cyanobacteria bacterium SZAS-4]|nr:DnaJ domain-containing protein [Cyanobacteria bacterium SZAS-4]
MSNRVDEKGGQMNESEIRRQLCDILGVSAQACEEEIKKAYTTEAKKWHPDRVQHNPELAAMAEKKLKEINQAYECLTDRVQFDKYAAKLAQKQSDATAHAKNQAASQSATSSTGTSQSSGHSQSSGSAQSTAAQAPADKAGIVKIFLATGLFVIIVVLVANLSAPRHEAPSNPGITLSPSDSPGAPFSGARTFTPQPPAVAPDSAVGAPPGSN